MAKAINYIVSDGTKAGVAVTFTGTNSAVDNNWTNITNYGALLDGTLVRYAVKYDPAVIQSNGICTGGTAVATYGSSAVVAPGVAVLDLGSPVAVSTTAIHAAITQGVAPSATGVHAAITLSTVAQTIATGITNPSGRFVSIVGNDTDMVGAVTINGTGESDQAISQTLALNGTTTVTSTLIFKTVTSIVVPPYAVDSSETVSVGTGAIATAIGITNADVPRTVTITGSASGITGNVLITGSYKGTVLTENIAANGTATVGSVNVYDKITQIQVPTKTNSSGDTIAVGTGDKIGLKTTLKHPTVFMTVEGTAAVGLGASSTFTQHINTTTEYLNYITFANASDGTDRRVYYVAE